MRKILTTAASCSRGIRAHWGPALCGGWGAGKKNGGMRTTQPFQKKADRSWNPGVGRGSATPARAGAIIYMADFEAFDECELDVAVVELDVAVVEQKTTARTSLAPDAINFTCMTWLSARCSARHPEQEFPMESFRPSFIERKTKIRNAFDESLGQLRALDSAGSMSEWERLTLIAGLLHQLEASRTKICAGCRNAFKAYDEDPTRPRGACRALWHDELRWKPCADCGEVTGQTEYDHPPGCVRKADVSGYYRWPGLGGVDEMRKEAELCTPRCPFDHLLQPTHNYYQTKYLRLEDMPPKRVGESEKLRGRRCKLEKRDFVHSIKKTIGKCQHPQCRRLVTSRTYHCFSFAHIDAATKEENGVGISELVADSASLKTRRPRIEAEIARSRLLCANHNQAETSERNMVA